MTDKIDVNKLEAKAREEFFKRVKKEILPLFRGTRNQQYGILYSRFLLGLCNKPYSNPKNQKQLEMRDEIYSLIKDSSVTPKNYPDLI